MPDATSIPGTVALPTWTLVVAILAEASALVWCVRSLIAQGAAYAATAERATAALNNNTDALERLAERIEAAKP